MLPPYTSRWRYRRALRSSSTRRRKEVLHLGFTLQVGLYGLDLGYIGAIVRLYWDNGKYDGNYYLGFRVVGLFKGPIFQLFEGLGNASKGQVSPVLAHTQH